MNSFNAFDKPPRYQPAVWLEYAFLLLLIFLALLAIDLSGVESWLRFVLSLMMLIAAAFELWLWRQKRVFALWHTQDEGWMMLDVYGRQFSVLSFNASLDWPWFMLVFVQSANGREYWLPLIRGLLEDEAFYAMRRHCAVKSA